MARELKTTGRIGLASTAVQGRAKSKTGARGKAKRRERRIDWRETKKVRLAHPRRAR